MAGGPAQQPASGSGDQGFDSRCGSLTGKAGPCYSGVTKRNDMKKDNAPKVPIQCVYDAMVPLQDIKPHPRNVNKHPSDQVKLLAKLIQSQGFRNPIVISNRSRLVVAGHARLEAARMIGLAEAPVDYQDFDTEEQEIQYLVGDNK